MRTGAVIDYIVNWLTDYCEHAGLHGFVAGVSGGIDSAVTSTLCARTGKDVILLNIPILQAADQVERSARHIQWLEKAYANVKGLAIDLTPVFQSFQQALPMNVQDKMTMANTRSRLRMVALYAVASHHRMLVAGTGNKIEDFGVGFYTKYGDGGVDLSPIADLMKTEVYEIGRALGVGRDILEATPTDGLWDDNRSDESQIGATYPELEQAMRFDAEGGDETSLDQRAREVLAIFRKFHAANRHKMEPIPVCRIPAALH